MLFMLLLAAQSLFEQVLNKHDVIFKIKLFILFGQEYKTIYKYFACTLINVTIKSFLTFIATIKEKLHD